jgi:group I intron endonuclease
MMKNNWYVYRHIRLDKNEPFYIGIGNKKNYARAYQTKPDRRNKIWEKIYLKTNIEIEIILDNLTKDEASTKEQEFIKLYGRKNIRTGTLCNLTDGGDGIWNCIRSDETKQKLRQQKLGNKNPMFGKTQSEETRLKRAKSLTGKKRNEKTKRKQSLSTVRSGQAKPVDVFRYENGDYVGRFYVISEACRVLGFHNLNGKASMVAKGKRSQTQGYVFKYVTN